MKRYGFGPQQLAGGLLIAGAWIACGATAQEVPKEAPGAPPETSAVPGTAPSLQRGLIACIDPDTGELVDPSEDPACGQDLETAGQRALGVEELEEQPAATGGFVVDLKGRFMKPLYATVDKDGDVDLGHEAPASK
jgi:hypothetical protein